MTDDEMIEKTRAGLRWVLADIEPGTRVHELTDEEVEDLARCRKSNAVMDNTVRELEADKALLREALGPLIEQCHDCEKELTESYYGVDFCGESLPLCNARAALEPKP